MKLNPSMWEGRATIGGSEHDIWEQDGDLAFVIPCHTALDLAVDRCYRKEPFHTDRERVGYLFALYEQLAAPLAVAKEKKPQAKKLRGSHTIHHDR